MIIFIEVAMFLCNLYAFICFILSALTMIVTVYRDLLASELEAIIMH